MTQSDRPEAEPRPVGHQDPDHEPWLNRWLNLPHVDPDKMRRDIDKLIDPSL